MIFFFRSSDARLSLSFAGTGTEAEISTRANIDANEDSTDWRRAAGRDVVPADASEPETVGERFLRRKLPAEMNAAAEAGVGIECEESDMFWSEGLESVSEDCFLWFGVESG